MLVGENTERLDRCFQDSRKGTSKFFSGTRGRSGTVALCARKLGDMRLVEAAQRTHHEVGAQLLAACQVNTPVLARVLHVLDRRAESQVRRKAVLIQNLPRQPALWVTTQGPQV